MSIDDIIVEEMEKVWRRKRWNQFWKYLTVFYALGIAAVYLFILGIGGVRGYEAIYLFFIAAVMAAVGMLVLLSPKAASFLAGVEENRYRGEKQ